jgi:hypothetical protein
VWRARVAVCECRAAARASLGVQMRACGVGVCSCLAAACGWRLSGGWVAGRRRHTNRNDNNNAHCMQGRSPGAVQVEGRGCHSWVGGWGVRGPWTRAWRLCSVGAFKAFLMAACNPKVASAHAAVCAQEHSTRFATRARCALAWQTQAQNQCTQRMHTQTNTTSCFTHRPALDRSPDTSRLLACVQTTP